MQDTIQTMEGDITLTTSNGFTSLFVKDWDGLMVSLDRIIESDLKYLSDVISKHLIEIKTEQS